MNSSVDIAVIKSAILEFEQITCNFYPFAIFVLTDGMRWTSCLNLRKPADLRNLFYSFFFFFFFFFFLLLFLSLFSKCENLTLWNFKDNLAIPSESSPHLTSMLDKAKREVTGGFPSVKPDGGGVTVGLIPPGNNAQSTPLLPDATAWDLKFLDGGYQFVLRTSSLLFFTPNFRLWLGHMHRTNSFEKSFWKSLWREKSPTCYQWLSWSWEWTQLPFFILIKAVSNSPAPLPSSRSPWKNPSTFSLSSHGLSHPPAKTLEKEGLSLLSYASSYMLLPQQKHYLRGDKYVPIKTFKASDIP